MSMHEDFLEILDWAVARAGSMRKLSDVTGLDTSTIVRWKSKARIPALDSIQPIFDFVGCSWDEAISKSRGLPHPPPASSPPPAEFDEELRAVRMELERLRLEQARLSGQVELLKELLREAQKAARSDVRQTVTGDKNTTVAK